MSDKFPAAPRLPGHTVDNTLSGTLKIVNYNVDGLPIPSFMSSTKKNTVNTTKAIGRYFHDYDFDLLCVQEDFDLHFLLSNGIDAYDRTYWDGGMGAGSGGNIFSSRALYNVGREAWKETCGIFDRGSDQLTPKGIVHATIKLADGAYADVYDIHADACEDDGSIDARFSEFRQLYNLIESRSAGHAVIVTGDFNTFFSMQSQEFSGSDKTRPGIGLYLRSLFRMGEEGGFREAWVENKFGGRYDFSSDDVHNEFSVKYPSGPWGLYDSAEKVLYRGSDAVTFRTVSHEYEFLRSEDGSQLSDHAAEFVTLAYTINPDRCKPESLLPNTYNFSKSVSRYYSSKFKTLRLLARELPGLISGKSSLDFMK